MTDLGKLEKVELRKAWGTEAHHFTPWLARPENIAILGNTLALDLEVQSIEQNVGLFRADIVCLDTIDDSFVLIENQLERTDHGHLGQIITYAAGTDAATIVWISAKFTEEHRAALDWLNEHTRDDVKFFGVQLELWKIGDSSPAPRFNIVSKPNDWTRTISNAAHAGNRPMTEMRELQLKYWMGFRDFMETNYPLVAFRSPKPRSWMTSGIGRSGFHLGAVTQSFDNWIRVELYIGGDRAKEYFHKLQEDLQRIESDFGEKLSWEELPEKKASRIAAYLQDVDPTDEADWPRQHKWLAENIQKLRTTFETRVRNLELDDAA